MDKICIDNLRVFANHGVFDYENQNGQNFYINAVLYLDTEKSGTSDSLEYSVDYGSVCSFIEKVMTESTFKLIETAAQELAVRILNEYSLLKGADIEVKKPEAPINMDFESVSVKIHRQWHRTMISAGSNMGDSKMHIESALDALENSRYIRNIKKSELIVTKPYGYTNQDDFLNGIIVCETLYSPHGLLDFLHSIENSEGRKRKIHWGPRTLDLDIVFYDDLVMSESDLVIPHPDMHNRLFVLEPAVQVAPYYRHPLLNLTISQLLERLNGSD